MGGTAYIHTISIVARKRRIAISQLHKIVHAVPRILCDATFILSFQELEPIAHVDLEAFCKQQLPVLDRRFQGKALLVRGARKAVGEEIHLFEQGFVVREGGAEIRHARAHLLERVAATGC